MSKHSIFINMIFLVLIIIIIIVIIIIIIIIIFFFFFFFFFFFWMNRYSFGTSQEPLTFEPSLRKMCCKREKTVWVEIYKVTKKNKYFTIQGTIPMVKEINHENRAIIPKETVAVTHEKKK